MSLVAGGIGPYSPAAGRGAVVAGFALLLAFQVWALARLLSGGIELAQINAGWLIILVGGIVLPGPAIALGLAAPAHFAFGISATVAPILMAILFYRAIAGPPLPEALRPTWFILLVPPSLIYANGIALYPAARLPRDAVLLRARARGGAARRIARASGAGRSARPGGPLPSRSTRWRTPRRATRRTTPSPLCARAIASATLRCWRRFFVGACPLCVRFAALHRERA